jgi:hypothetical protein
MHPGGFKADQPFELIVIDTVGKLPYSDGFVKLLTVVDVFSKLAIAIPIPNERSETVGRALQQRVFSVYGYPRILLSDRAKGFVGDGLKWLCRHIGVAKIHTTGLLPTGASPVERYHRSLSAALTVTCNRAKNDWASQVDAVTFAYNISVNETTGFSPFYLTTGRHPNIPLSVLTGLRQARVRHKNHTFVERMTGALNSAYQYVRQRQLKTLERNTRVQLGLRSGATQSEVDKALMDRPIPGFRVGELVSYWEPEIAEKEIEHVIPRKLQYRWTGPHKIDRREGNHYYIHRKGEVRQVNPGRLRKYHSWTEDQLEGGKESEVDQEQAQEGVLGGSESQELDVGPQVGDMVIVALQLTKRQSRPFIVGKVMAARPGSQYLLRWFGNEQGDMSGTYRPRWDVVDSSGQKKRFYSHDNEGNIAAQPVTSDTRGEIVCDRHILVSGFQLQFDDRLPREVQHQIHDSSGISWYMPERE